jgi:hypothetical protein
MSKPLRYTAENIFETDLLSEDIEAARVDRDILLRERIRRAELLKATFGTPAGMECLWMLMEQSGHWESKFTANSNTFYLLGAWDQNQALIDAVSAVCPEAAEYVYKRKVAKERDQYLQIITGESP